MNTKILEDIERERNRQDAKWGAQQTHPDNDPEVKSDPIDACLFAGMWPEKRAKHYNETCVAFGVVNWAGILGEEFAEALSATVETDKAHLREELVQVAAVAAAWIEDLDSRGTK